MSTVVLSTCLFGAQPLYTDGALRLAQQTLPRLRAALASHPPRLRVYHDASVPTRVLRALEQTPHVELVDASAHPWRGNRRAMWRFLALQDCRRVMFLDTDMPRDLLLCLPVLSMLRKVASAPLHHAHLWTWRPSWSHEGRQCVPACFTAITLPTTLTGLGGKLSRFAASHRNLSHGSNPAKLPRYADGYGLDEWYLTFHLLPRLKAHKTFVPMHRFPLAFR